MSEPALLPDVLQLQSGIVTRQQLDESGLSEGYVRAQLDGRRWRSLNDHVVICHNGPLTEQQQLWAVCLSAPPPVAACSVTALALWGLRGHETEVVHVVVPKGVKPLSTPGVRRHVHESRRFADSDVWPIGRPVPLTAVPRSAIDAAVWERDPRTSVRLLTNVVQQRLCSPDELVEALDRAGRVRHHRLLRPVLVDMAGGAQAVSELAFLRFCRRHGFPTPRLQVRLDAGGRRRYLDATFRRYDGALIRVEIDGGVHLTLTQRWRDTRNDNDAVLAGELVLRFPSVAVYLDDPAAVAQLAQALQLVRR